MSFFSLKPPLSEHRTISQSIHAPSAVKNRTVCATRRSSAMVGRDAPVRDEDERGDRGAQHRVGRVEDIGRVSEFMLT
jgi:hypothetical protein